MSKKEVKNAQDQHVFRFNGSRTFRDYLWG